MAAIERICCMFTPLPKGKLIQFDGHVFHFRVAKKKHQLSPHGTEEKQELEVWFLIMLGGCIRLRGNMFQTG